LTVRAAVDAFLDFPKINRSPHTRRAYANVLQWLAQAVELTSRQQEGRNRRNPHVDPRLVGDFDDPVELELTVGESGRRDFRRLVSLLDQPLAAAGVGRDKRPVYHLVISARTALVDRYLSDSEWRDIAVTYLDHIGLAPRGDDLGCRWREPPTTRSSPPRLCTTSA